MLHNAVGRSAENRNGADKAKVVQSLETDCLEVALVIAPPFLTCATWSWLTEKLV